MKPKQGWAILRMTSFLSEFVLLIEAAKRNKLDDRSFNWLESSSFLFHSFYPQQWHIYLSTTERHPCFSFKEDLLCAFAKCWWCFQSLLEQEYWLFSSYSPLLWLLSSQSVSNTLFTSCQSTLCSDWSKIGLIVTCSFPGETQDYNGGISGVQ